VAIADKVANSDGKKIDELLKSAEKRFDGHL
jgi:hypothetical protein